MSEKNENKNKEKRSKSGVLIPLVVFAALLFALLSMIGLFGGNLKGFFLGALGFMGYGLVSVALLVFLLVKLHILKKAPKARTLVFIVLLSVVFLVYLHIV